MHDPKGTPQVASNYTNESGRAYKTELSVMVMNNMQIIYTFSVISGHPEMKR